MSRQRKVRGIGTRATGMLARAAVEALERRQMMAATAAVAYEGFDNYSGNLAGQTGGTGFTGAWTLQSGATSPNYTIEGDGAGDVLVDPFKGYAGGSAQHYVTDANVYSVGRSLDVTGAFSTWKRADNGHVGKDGTTLWVSALVRRDTEAGTNTDPTRVSFHNSSLTLHDTTARRLAALGYFGAGSNNGSGHGVWSVEAGGNVVQTNKVIVPGQTVLLVVRFDFAAATDTVSLWVNPSPTALSSTPDASNTASVDFINVGHYGGSGAGSIDNIRFGASYESVVTSENLVPTNSQTWKAELDPAWSAVGGATYDLYRGTSSPVALTVGNRVASGTASAFVDTGYAPGTTRVYQVVATLSSGVKLLSPEASMTTVAAAGVKTSNDYLGTSTAGITLPVRKDLYDELSSTAVPSATRTALLNAYNANNMATFDSTLLTFMSTGSRAARYFWGRYGTADADQFVDAGLDYITGNFSPTQRGSPYLEILNEQATAASTGYTGTGGTDTEVLSLAYAYRYTLKYNGTAAAAKYGEKLASVLSTFATATLPPPHNAAHALANAGDTFDNGQRATHWLDAYFLMLGTPAFAASDNTLFIYALLKEGQFLYNGIDQSLPNKAAVQASGQIDLATALPEFADGNDWIHTTQGTNIAGVDQLTGALGHMRADGSYDEQSPSYQELVLAYAETAYKLARLNGDDVTYWNGVQAKLIPAIDGYSQQLEPDGTNTVLSDTKRDTGLDTMLAARFFVSGIASQSVWPVYLPTTGGVFKIGSANLGTPAATLTPPNRGQTKAYNEGGYYVMRSPSTDGANARQVVFDVGPTYYKDTKFTHGHFDLLSFDLYGYQRALLPSPGPFNGEDPTLPGTDPHRVQAVSTAFHNTIVYDANHDGVLDENDNQGGFKEENSFDAVAEDFHTDATGAWFSAHHRYSGSNNAALARSVWYDQSGTMVILDRVDTTDSTRLWGSTFNLPGTDWSVNGSGQALDTGTDSGVMIQPVLLSGGGVGGGGTVKATLTPGDRFYTSARVADNPATQYLISNKGNTFIATVVSTYDPATATAPTVTATFSTTPILGQPITIQVVRNGVSKTVTFPPQFGTVLQRTDDGQYQDVALDGTGRRHLAYIDGAGNLMYTQKDAANTAGWTGATNIATAPLTDWNFSLEVDGGNLPGIAFYSSSGTQLVFAKRSAGGVWGTSQIANGPSVGLYPSLKFDGSTPYVTYYDAAADTLKFKWQSGGAWNNVEAPDPATGVGRYSSLVVKSGVWKVAYADTAGNKLKFANRLGANNWSVSTVATTTGGVKDISLALDSGNLPTITYYDIAAAALKMARFNGTTWTIELVSTNGSAVQGLSSNVFLDAGGNPSVVFYRADTDTTISATKSGGVWSFATVHNGGANIRADRYGGVGTTLYSAEGDITGETEVRVF